ncbi:MAG: molecular chaperone HtpG [Spirochaetota bacterium]|nr:molecular chaperone HtpG [Spirochaetota bacterium]
MPKNMKFKTETQKILHLVTHSLYSNRDIFLRELISNASDAIDKARFESLTNNDLLEGDSDWKIKLAVDKENNSITIMDNGIGMNEEDVIENLGTIAKSGTQAFLEIIQQGNLKDSPELIGQFGVGFYSAFMVADRVTVKTRRAGGKDEAILWECHGEEEYTIEKSSKDARGTEITLYLNEESREYLEEWKIRDIVKKYSDYIEFPVSMDIERSETPRDEDGKPKEGAEPVKTVKEEILNSQKAIWLRPKEEIKDEEYEEFYRHLSHDFSSPLTHLHYKVEGTTEFTSLIYLPAKRPFNLFTKDQPKNNVHLYVKRVFILKESESVLPEYLRFVSGVVDSSDLPLNVSREHLQEHRILKTIKKNLVKKVLTSLKDMKEKDFDKYKGFYEEFGTLLKEGVYTDHENKELLLSLLLFKSTKTGDDEYTDLDKYVQNMVSGQEDVYYIPGESLEDVKHASHLEVFREKDYEVLYFVEPIDEIMMQMVTDYQEKKLKSVTRGDIDLGKKDEKEKEAENEKYKSLNEFIQKSLEDHVKEVKLSDRLTSSACCLVADEFGMSAHMEKLMSAYNKDMPKTKRIMEINPGHAVVVKMQSLFEAKNDDPILKEYAELLYDQALIVEGSKLPDPVRFTERLSNLMLKN